MNSLSLKSILSIDEKYVLLLACFIIGFAPLQGVLILTLRLFVIVPGKIDTAITYIIYWGTLLLALRTIINRIKWDSFCIILFFLIAYLLSIGIYGTDLDDWLGTGAGILLSVSFYFVGRSITDFKKIKSYLRITGIFIGYSAFLLFFVLNKIEENTYSQYSGYVAMTAAVISVSVLFEKFKLIHLANLILSLSVIIYAGARGPFVCFILFVGIKFLLIRGMSFKKHTLIIILTGVIVVLILLYFQEILGYLSGIGAGKGYSLRLLTKMTNETLLKDVDRDLLRRYSIQLISENPIFGVGIYNDRILLTNLMGVSISETAGWYPHNFFLEVLLQFGIIVGSLMIVWILWVFYRAIIINRDVDSKDVLLMFFAFGFLPLLFSESYLRTGLFFLLLGLCVTVLKNESVAERVL